MNDIQGYQNGPVESGASRAKEMSPRAYNLVMSALIFWAFAPWASVLTLRAPCRLRA